MDEIIKIKYEEGKGLVSARELYEFLEIKVHFSTWMKRMCEYGFQENIDFSILKSGNQNGGIDKIDDYVITSDMAKEISMLQRTDKGRKARLYFIQCEKKLKEIVDKPMLPEDYLSALKALVASEEEKALMKPKVEYYESVLQPETYVKLLTTSEIAKDLQMSAQALHIKLNELGVIYKQNKTWMFYSKYQDRIPEYADYTINEHAQTLKWTEKGREWIIGLLKTE